MNDVDYGRLQAFLECGEAVSEVAKRLKCSHRTVRYWRDKPDLPSIHLLPRSGEVIVNSLIFVNPQTVVA